MRVILKPLRTSKRKNWLNSAWKPISIQTTGGIVRTQQKSESYRMTTWECTRLCPKAPLEIMVKSQPISNAII
jgi:hypothetical protein